MPTTTSWITPTQAARLLQLSAQRIRQLTDQGRLSFVRTPLGRLLDPASVARLRAERRRRRDPKKAPMRER